MKTRHFQDNAECRRHIRVTLTLDVLFKKKDEKK